MDVCVKVTFYQCSVYFETIMSILNDKVMNQISYVTHVIKFRTVLNTIHEF